MAEAPSDQSRDATDFASALTADLASVASESNRTRKWTCGNFEFDQGLLQFLSIFSIVAIICGVSLYNLTVTKEKTELWTALLSMTMGVLLPQPTTKSSSPSRRRLTELDSSTTTSARYNGDARD
jgi:hypothetical protein